MQEIMIYGFTFLLQSIIAGAFLCSPFYFLTNLEK